MIELATCPICYNVMSQMMVPKCKHTICKGCFNGLEEKCCPLCNNEIEDCYESNFDLYKSLYLLDNHQIEYKDENVVSYLLKASIHDEWSIIYMDISRLYGVDIPKVDHILDYGRDDKKNTKISSILTTVELTSGETINLIQYAWRMDKFERLRVVQKVDNDGKKNIRRYDIYNVALMLACKTFLDYLKAYAIRILKLRVDGDSYNKNKVGKYYKKLLCRFESLGYGTPDSDLRRSIDIYLSRTINKGWKIQLSELYIQLKCYYTKHEIDFYLKHYADINTKKLFKLVS